MRPLPSIAVLASIALLPGLGPWPESRARAQEGDRAVVAHPRGEATIEVDGRLDEPIWQEAEEASGFVERTPEPGARPPTDTRFRVLFDREALYVGVVLELLPGEEPRALTLSRDSFRIFSDDAVTLKIDVAHDHRTTVGFAVNPAGTQLDYVAIENGDPFRVEFDAVWEAVTRIGEDAWIVEYRIPVEALGLSEAEGERVMGFEVTRDHNARFATDDWTHIPPEFGPVSALHYGELRGLRGLGSGTPLTLIPYVLVGWPNDEVLLSDLPLRLHAGGDARMRLAEDVWGEVTVLTDFAQVDLDDQVVNLDRFPLFLPEKRPFFLSGLDVFELGDEGNAQLFFSRRIGIDGSGRRVPLWGGLKLYGREGAFRFGLLDVITARSDGQPATHWGVGRLRLDVGDASYVGIMGTARNALDGSGQDGYAGGIDGAVRALDERLELRGAVATTSTPESAIPGDTDHGSALASARLLGEVLQPSASVLYVGERFDPDVGFVLRKGVVRFEGALPAVHRTDTLGLQSVTLTATGGLDTDTGLDLRLGASGGGEIAADFPAWGLSAGAGWTEDVVLDAFELLPDLLIPAGTYRGVYAEYSLHASSLRNPSGSITYRGSNGFFGGVSHSVTADVATHVGPHLRLGAAAAQSFVDIPGHSTRSPLTVNSSITVAPSTRLTADLIFQLNDVRETTVGLARLRWRYLPGSDVFVVYRQDLAFDGTLDAEVVLKATYRWDALL